MIDTPIRRIISVLEEYRRLSLLPSPKKEEIEVGAAIKGIVLLLEMDAKDRGIQIRTKIETPDLKIFADPLQFEMIIINLLKNAFESFEGKRQGLQVLIHTKLSGNRVVVSVEDTGMGIPEKGKADF